MKNWLKVLRIIAMVAVIGFSMAGCGKKCPNAKGFGVTKMGICYSFPSGDVAHDCDDKCVTGTTSKDCDCAD